MHFQIKTLTNSNCVFLSFRRETFCLELFCKMETNAYNYIWMKLIESCASKYRQSVIFCNYLASELIKIDRVENFFANRRTWWKMIPSNYVKFPASLADTSAEWTSSKARSHAALMASLVGDVFHLVPFDYDNINRTMA